KLSGVRGEYRCPVDHGGCGGVGIKATPLEQHLLAELVRRPAPQPVPPREAAHAGDVSHLLEELRAVETRLEEVADGLADGTLTVAVAGRATSQLDERRRALTEELARTLPPPEESPPPL